MRASLRSLAASMSLPFNRSISIIGLFQFSLIFTIVVGSWVFKKVFTEMQIYLPREIVFTQNYHIYLFIIPIIWTFFSTLLLKNNDSNKIIFLVISSGIAIILAFLILAVSQLSPFIFTCGSVI